MNASSRALVRAVARAGLGPFGDPPLTEPILEPAWDELLRACVLERLVGFLHQAAASGELPLSPEQRVEVVRAQRGATALDLLLEARMFDVAAVLEAAEVDYRLLKGPALAHAVYAVPHVRHFGDIDLLVRSADVDRAVRSLVASGRYRRRSPEIRPGFDRRFAKSVTLVGDDGVEVDVHRTLVPGVYGARLDQDALWQRPSNVVIAGRMMPTMAPDLLLLHATLGAALADSPPRLAVLRDVAELIRGGAADLTHFSGLAHEHGVAAACALGIARCSETLEIDLGPLGAWAAHALPGPSDRRHIAAYREGAGFRAEAREVLRTLSWPDRVRYARALALPSGEYLAHRGLGRVAWIRRGRRAADQDA